MQCLTHPSYISLTPMKPHSRITIALAALLLVAIASTNQGLAQNETGVRHLNKDRFKQEGYWYDSTTAMYQERFPIIRSLPPLSTDMPLDILLSYIYLDSCARFDTGETVLRKLFHWKTMNDTLKGMLTYYYKLTDYDPILFNQYLWETNLKLRTRYVAALRPVADALREALLRAAPHREEAQALHAALYADNILRVRVLSVDSMLGKPEPSPLNPYVYRVTAEVLDTIKGRVFAACGGLQAKTDPDHGVAQSTTPCIRFIYARGNYYQVLGENADMPKPPKRDSAFMSYEGGFKMHAGQEAIVFLGMSPSLFDSSNDYFNVWLQPLTSYNALPIIDGMVRDMNHYWSASDLMTYADWKTRYLQIRDKILTGNY